MLVPQAPMNFKLQLFIIYAAQIISRIFFYVIAYFYLPNVAPTTANEMSEQLKWVIVTGAVIVSLVSEWLHLQARNADHKHNLQALKNCYVMTWGLSELLSIAGIIVSLQFGPSDLNHALFLSSLFLGLWQVPRFQWKGK